jgi:rsbT co-antagonist protein RsbR
MASSTNVRLADIVGKYEKDLLIDWVKDQLTDDPAASGLMTEAELGEQSREFLRALHGAMQTGSLEHTDGPEWQDVRQVLSNISLTRARKGFGPSQTATFVFSLKRPLFDRLRRELAQDPATLAQETWTISLLLDKLGLFTTEIYQKGRNEVIARQQQEMMELSTPVVQLWDNVLALPLIGTLDSERTQIVMENLLQKIMDTGSQIAIIDITGVPMVDTLVAQHLLKTVAAARLMGADCIISGIRPQIAQTIVHLGVDLTDVVTKSTLADAFLVALKRTGASISHASRQA